VDAKPDMSQQCSITALKDNHIIGCIKSSLASRVGKGICPSEISPGVLHPDVESSLQERCEPAGACPEEGYKNDPSNGTPSLCGQAERVGSVHLGKEKALACDLSVFKGRTIRENKLFSRVCYKRTRENGFKLTKRRFRLDIRKKDF